MNVTIGILDTGVDTGAIGLQLLPGSEGAKIVYVHGCNDVDVSDATAKLVDGEEGKGWWEVEGLSERTLKLNPDWNTGAFPASAVDEKDDSTVEKDEKDETDSAEETKGDTEKDTKTVKVRLGIKRAYELYPSKTVLNRVKSERSKQFQSAQRVHAASLRAKLEAFAKKNTGDLTPALLEQKQDWEYQQQQHSRATDTCAS